MRRRRGPLVSEVSRGRLHIETGRPETVINTDRVAIVAQFSTGPRQPRSLSEYLRRLTDNGYTTIVVSTCESPEPLEFPHGLPETTMVLRRPNLGYDFGSWATALGCFPELRGIGTVLLTNDSLLGPFEPIDHLLEWVSAPGPDIRGMTASYQFARHIQSYFLAYRGGILQDQPWRDFFNSIRVEPDKDDVVLAYELGVSRVSFSECYSTDVWVTGPELGVPYSNPTVDGWKNLIESGSPFLKRTIMTHPSTMAQAAEAAQYIKRRFATDITTW